MQNGDPAIIVQNIRELQMRGELLSEQMDISLALLADMIADEIKKDPSDEKTAIIDKYVSLLEKEPTVISPSEYILFFRELSERTGEYAPLHTDSDGAYEIFSSIAPSKISYVKNNYSDAAFMRFSSIFSLPKVAYESSFEEVCESVYNAACDYCILPIENAANGKLFSFYSLIGKYDLKIFAVCDLDDGLVGKRTRYALLSRKKLIRHDSTGRLYFEFSIIDDKNYSISDILEAAKCCSLRLYRIDTLPVPYDDLTFRYYHVFEGERAGILPFLMYLENKYPQYETIGHYISL